MREAEGSWATLIDSTCSSGIGSRFLADMAAPSHSLREKLKTMVGPDQKVLAEWKDFHKKAPQGKLTLAEHAEVLAQGGAALNSNEGDFNTMVIAKSLLWNRRR